MTDPGNRPAAARPQLGPKNLRLPRAFVVFVTICVSLPFSIGSQRHQIRHKHDSAPHAHVAACDRAQPHPVARAAGSSQTWPHPHYNSKHESSHQLPAGTLLVRHWPSGAVAWWGEQGGEASRCLRSIMGYFQTSPVELPAARAPVRPISTGLRLRRLRQDPGEAGGWFLSSNGSSSRGRWPALGHPCSSSLRTRGAGHLNPGVYFWKSRKIPLKTGKGAREEEPVLTLVLCEAAESPCWPLGSSLALWDRLCPSSLTGLKNLSPTD